ncbi:MAG: hypothetical protein M1826_001845 [Phylliscum demangeonii]|nr:MAG: hypothetical protein M1826_001845 [Phylliscum demangeonii]
MAPDFPRSGPFPFLRLPPELRDRVYREVVRPLENRHQGPYFRGRLDLALLSACRQVYQESRHIPFTFKFLYFDRVFNAYRLFTQRLAPFQKAAITSVKLDFEKSLELYELNLFSHLCTELGKTSLRHLALTIRERVYDIEGQFGPLSYPVEQMSSIKTLQKFDLELSYFGTSPEVNKRATKMIRSVLLSKPKDPSVSVVFPCRAASRSGAKSSSGPSAFVIGPSTGPLVTPEASPSGLPATFEGIPQPVPSRMTNPALMEAFARLSDYADTFDHGRHVRIRMEWAKEAAEKGDAARFATVAEDITKTLEEQLQLSLKARKHLTFLPPLSED